jgi:hypothetical protein
LIFICFFEKQQIFIYDIGLVSPYKPEIYQLTEQNRRKYTPTAFQPKSTKRYTIKNLACVQRKYENGDKFVKKIAGSAVNRILLSGRQHCRRTKYIKQQLLLLCPI